MTYAEPLKTYGTLFAVVKNLTATTDAEKIFLSSFAPSTIIDNTGNLVESNTSAGLTAVDMWDCAIEACNADKCLPFGVVGGNKSNIKLLTNTIIDSSTLWAGNVGVALMVGDYYSYIEREKLFNVQTWDIISQIIKRHESITTLMDSYEEGSSEFLYLLEISQTNPNDITESQAESSAILLGYNSLSEFTNERLVLRNQIENFTNTLNLANRNQVDMVLKRRIDANYTINRRSRRRMSQKECVERTLSAIYDFGSVKGLVLGAISIVQPEVAVAVLVGAYAGCKIYNK